MAGDGRRARKGGNTSGVGRRTLHIVKTRMVDSRLREEGNVEKNTALRGRGRLHGRPCRRGTRRASITKTEPFVGYQFR